MPYFRYMTSLEQLYHYFRQSTGVCTDTRQLKPGNLFFALRGEHFDGNKFAARALEAGASYAVVDDSQVAQNERYLAVPDVLESLQQLATHHRQQLGLPVVALTGSNGKTTTKELIREVLATRYRVWATPGNLNNHIGVPLTLLSIPPGSEIAVVEMGANHMGEIAALCQIARPTHGLITNIGKAHLEGFGSLEGVLRAKSELYDFLIKNEGVIFVNSDDPMLMNMAKRIKNPVFYNNPGDFYHGELIEANPFVVFKADNGETVHTQLPGAYNFKNIAAALCVGKYFEVDATAANRAVAEYVPQNNRSQFLTRGSNRIILDAYNANPISMQAALDNLAAMQHPAKIVILGDMLELGADSQKEHRLLGERVAAIQPEQALFCGPESRAAAAACPDSLYFANKAELTTWLQQHPLQNKLILIKASRGMGLETLLDVLPDH